MNTIYTINEISAIRLWLKTSKQTSQKVDVKKNYYFWAISIIFLKTK